MQKNIHLLLIILSCFGMGFSQPPPPKALFETMKEILKNTKFLKQQLSSIDVDTTVQIADIIIGNPIPVYTLRPSEISKIEIDTPVLSITEFTRHWIFFLKVQGSEYCRVRLFCNDTKCEFVSVSTPLPSWSEIRSAYPEKSGIIPIIVRSKETFVHFPKINSHNLTLLTDSSYRASLRDQKKSLMAKRTTNEEDIKQIEGELSITTDSYRSLVDSRKVYSFLKERNAVEEAKNRGLRGNQ